LQNQKSLRANRIPKNSLDAQGRQGVIVKRAPDAKGTLFEGRSVKKGISWQAWPVRGAVLLPILERFLRRLR